MQGLKHQTGRAGRADIERQVARLVVLGPEDQLARADSRTDHLGVAELDGGVYRRLVLGPQARLVPIGADADHAEWPAGQERQRQSGAEDLATPFTARAIEPDRIHSFRRACRLRYHDPKLRST